MSIEDQRQRWKAHWQEFHELSSAWEERGYSGPDPSYPALPDDLVGMTCGAMTRAGTPCKQKAIYTNGRCKFHGGLATGPITEAGKEQSRINGRKGGRPRKDGAVLSDVAVLDASGETEVIEHQGNPKVRPDAQVSARGLELLHGMVLGQGEVTNFQTSGWLNSAPEKPKSCTLKEVKVSAICERCTMFASNGVCLAVAKGRIPSMPTGDTCDAFSAF